LNVAILSDIHGNFDALSAVGAELADCSLAVRKTRELQEWVALACTAR